MTKSLRVVATVARDNSDIHPDNREPRWDDERMARAIHFFHGTTEGRASAIMEKGFRAGYTKRTIHGRTSITAWPGANMYGAGSYQTENEDDATSWSEDKAKEGHAPAVVESEFTGRIHPEALSLNHPEEYHRAINKVIEDGEYDAVRVPAGVVVIHPETLRPVRVRKPRHE